MSVGRGRKTINKTVRIGSDKLSVNIGGSDENLPVAVAEGDDTAATLLALITALDAAGIIDYTPTA